MGKINGSQMVDLPHKNCKLLSKNSNNNKNNKNDINNECNSSNNILVMIIIIIIIIIIITIKRRGRYRMPTTTYMELLVTLHNELLSSNIIKLH